jgi:hypothetical protein
MTAINRVATVGVDRTERKVFFDKIDYSFSDLKDAEISSTFRVIEGRNVIGLDVTIKGRTHFVSANLRTLLESLT